MLLWVVGSQLVVEKWGAVLHGNWEDKKYGSTLAAIGRNGVLVCMAFDRDGIRVLHWDHGEGWVQSTSLRGFEEGKEWGTATGAHWDG